jgi:putative cell wall-binding protein
MRVITTSQQNDLGQGLQWMAVDAPGRQAYVVGSASNTVAVIDLEGTAALSRRGGSDRFVVSAAASASEFASGSDVAYVATGSAFPDALSASAAAGVKEGPVLLVTRDSVPTAIGAELARLKPKKIVLLGGTAAVSAPVETALNSYAPVTRLAGADRFAVSAAVSRDAFPTPPPVAYVASGENFPDALSGGAVAARAGGPVLLVQRDGVPDAVRAELLRLQPAKIVLLGGENAVSAGVSAALNTIAPTTRIAGADRFTVSAAVSASVFTAGAGTAYIASGSAFPDALSGGPIATANSAPVLLVRPDGIPDAVAAELRRLAPNRIVVLGGPAAVSPEVYEQLRDYLPR